MGLQNSKAFIYLILGLALLTGCTAAVPDVTSLQSISPFASKSSNPFLQTNPGSYFIVSGNCIHTVTGFELRLDNLPAWTQIPMTPPTPATGEYLVGTPEYDTDCSDGTFNFYIFHSQVTSNYTLNGQPDLDPYKVEIAAISSFPVPTIVFERPRPVTFSIEDYYRRNTSQTHLEAGKSVKFQVILRDSYGEETRPLQNDIAVTYNLTNITNPLNSVGIIRQDDCTSTPAAADSIFSSTNGDRIKNLCFKATGVIPNDTIRLDVTAANMITASYEFKVQPEYTAVLALQPSLSSYELPPYFIKGLEYPLRFQMNPLFYEDRSVSSYQGNVALSTSSPLVLLKANAGDTNCSDTFQGGSLTCSNVTNSTKNFILKVSNNFTGSFVTLSTLATPTTSCGTNCQIYDSTTSPYFFNIGAYIPSYYWIPIVDGPSTFTQPYMNSNSGGGSKEGITINQCQQASVGAGNAKEQLIPAPTSLSWTITSPSGNVTFYSSHEGCNTGSGGASSYPVSVSTGGLSMPLYYKVTSIPADGKVSFQFFDGTNTWTKYFYLKND